MLTSTCKKVYKLLVNIKDRHLKSWYRKEKDDLKEKVRKSRIITIKKDLSSEFENTSE